MENDGISWKMMEYHGISWNIMEYRDARWGSRNQLPDRSGEHRTAEPWPGYIPSGKLT